LNNLLAPVKRDEIIFLLRDLLSKDVDPHSGRLWSYVYETGSPGLRSLAEEAYREALWRNMLDPTVFPSVLTMEKEVVSFALQLFNAPESADGNFTSGGTETNFLALLAAREYFRESMGKSTVPEVLAPVTVHPSVAKAAWQLGLRLTTFKVDGEYRADVNDLAEKLMDNTAAVVLSAPNYPFGTFDPVREAAEVIGEKRVWLHVDSCLGFTAPLAKRLGRSIPVYDFSVERVDSLGVDLHKMAYAPRGASLILHRDKNTRKHRFFVYSRWPGYPIVNQVAMSSRTAGPLAASWILLKTLGIEGYLELTKASLTARDMLVEAMTGEGFRLEGDPPYVVLAFSHPEKDLVDFAAKAGSRGWHIQVQPGSRVLGFPMTVHFTVTPVHASVVDRFKEDLPVIMNETRSMDQASSDPLLESLKTLTPSQAGSVIPVLIEALGASGGKGLEGADLGFIARYIHELDPGVVEVLFREIANLLL